MKTRYSASFVPSRLVILLAAFAFLLGALIVRAAWIQLIPNRRLEALKQRQFETTITLGSRRGDILDRNGNALAASTTAWSLFADPKEIENPKRVAQDLTSILMAPSDGRNSSRLRTEKKMAQNLAVSLTKMKSARKRFIWVERQFDNRTKERIQKLIEDRKLRGLGFIEEPKRIYPNQTLMANVLGFVGQEGRGLEGLEMKMNDQLSSSLKKVAMQRDARGRPLIVNGQIFTESPQGSNIELTIDRELQFVVEKELSNAVREHEAESGTAIVLDAQTSEILSMATLPTFDANDGVRVNPEIRRNRALTDVFEPGSTLKTFVIAGAFEEKLLEPNSKIFAENGHMKIGKRTIREADTQHKFGWITVTELLAQSSNIGSTKVAQMLGDIKLREIYSRFGFGEKSGVDLPGEARGVLQPLPWGDHLLANVSFGHGVSVNALQVANAYASIANGGWLKRPYIVKRVQDAETGETLEGKPKTLRRVLGDEAVSRMRLILTSVTSDEGTGYNARVPGFPVAGKTGTAQRAKVNGRGYEAGAYTSSFAGFIPANDPKFVIYVVLDRPRKAYYGSAVAAPVFSRIAQYAVRRAGLPPVLIAAKNVIPIDAAQKARNPQGDASQWRKENGVKTEAQLWNMARRTQLLNQLALMGTGGLVDSPLLALSKGIETESEDAALEPNLSSTEDSRTGDRAPAQTGTGVALRPPSRRRPEVAGLSLREAMETLSAAGISWKNVRVNGQGFVAKTRWARDNNSVTLELSR